MQRILGLEALREPLAASVVTIGKFFAVHRGHQALIRSACRQAQSLALPAVVLTFDRHPQEVLKPGRQLPILASLEERLDLFEQLGADIAVVMSTTRKFLSLSPEEFVQQVLVKRIHARVVVAGQEFRFGRRAAGDLAALRSYGAEYGFEVVPAPAVAANGERISSSLVAVRISAGEVREATELLGRPYAVAGTVVEGQRQGRELGFPTANIELDANRLLPANGVYVAELLLGDAQYNGVANLGVRPTLGGADRVLEIHLLDFEGDLYGAEVRLRFLERLRAERRFDSLAALTEQIQKDARQARTWFEQR